MSDMGEILGTPPAGDDNPEGFVSNDQSEDRAGTAAGASTDTGPAPDTEPDAGEVRRRGEPRHGRHGDRSAGLRPPRPTGRLRA